MNSNTTAANYAFVVKEHPNRIGWQVVLEPRNGNLPVLEDGLVCLVLNDSVSEEEARALSRHLEEKVKSISLTKTYDAD